MPAVGAATRDAGLPAWSEPAPAEKIWAGSPPGPGLGNRLRLLRSQAACRPTWPQLAVWGTTRGASSQKRPALAVGATTQGALNPGWAGLGAGGTMYCGSTSTERWAALTVSAEAQDPRIWTCRFPKPRRAWSPAGAALEDAPGTNLLGRLVVTWAAACSSWGWARSRPSIRSCQLEPAYNPSFVPTPAMLL